MKPLRTFMFFLAVALTMLLLAYAIPENGIQIAPGFRLSFMDLSEVSLADTGTSANRVEELLSASSVTEDPEADFVPLVPLADFSPGGLPADPSPHRLTMDTAPGTRSMSPAPGTRSMQPSSGSLPYDTASGGGPEAILPYVAPANADSLRRAIYPIQFPGPEKGLLVPFFEKLNGLLSGDLARSRVLHFGDSQIENDRMTALIRYRLQRQFGGSGTGLVQAVPLYSGSLAYRQRQEGEWLRYTFFGTRDSTIRHNAYGIMGAFTSVPPLGNGSSGAAGPEAGDGDGTGPGSHAGREKQDEESRSWPWLQYDFNTSRRTGTVDRVRVFLHAYRKGGAMAFTANDSIRDTIRRIPSGFSVADFALPVRMDQFRLAARLPEGGRIYGISFESHRGLQVDNIAMRGGSGLIFTKMNREQQLRMLEYLSPGLIILQYGGNVVPYINAARYGRKFRQELAFLKDLCPGVPIILIGPSDMSLKEKGEFVTYPGVEPVRDALRKAAMESGVAFWDLYEAMGGRNSMPSFVHSDPPLASTDYVHFTALGVNLVAEMFYNALMQEYQRYLSRP